MVNTILQKKILHVYYIDVHLNMRSYRYESIGY